MLAERYQIFSRAEILPGECLARIRRSFVFVALVTRVACLAQNRISVAMSIGSRAADYVADKEKRLGEDPTQPHRMKYKRLA